MSTTRGSNMSRRFAAAPSATTIVAKAGKAPASAEVPAATPTVEIAPPTPKKKR